MYQVVNAAIDTNKYQQKLAAQLQQMQVSMQAMNLTIGIKQYCQGQAGGCQQGCNSSRRGNGPPTLTAYCVAHG